MLNILYQLQFTNSQQDAKASRYQSSGFEIMQFVSAASVISQLNNQPDFKSRPQRGRMFVERCSQKNSRPQRGRMFVERCSQKNSRPQRGRMFVERNSQKNSRPQRGRTFVLWCLLTVWLRSTFSRKVLTVGWLNRPDGKLYTIFNEAPIVFHRIERCLFCQDSLFGVHHEL